MGAIAGIAGDKYSLGFVAETERQVSLHLQHHLSQLPLKMTVHATVLIRNRMMMNYIHRDTALNAGGVDFANSCQNHHDGYFENS